MRSVISFVAAVAFVSLTACSIESQGEETDTVDQSLTAARPFVGHGKPEQPAFARPFVQEQPRIAPVSAPKTGDDVMPTERPRCQESVCNEAELSGN